MTTKAFARPGALRMSISFGLSILTCTTEFCLLGISNEQGLSSSPFIESLMIAGPGVLFILAWHYSIGFQAYAASKKIGKKETDEWLSKGLLGTYLLLTMPERSEEFAKSNEARLDDAEKNASNSIGPSPAKQVKLTLIAACFFIVFSMTLPWMLWLTNYGQAYSDYTHGSWNTIRIGFAETALKQFPNSEDLAKVLSLKSKIYQSLANQMNSNHPALTKKEAEERNRDISELERVAKEAAGDAQRLQTEHWGVSSPVAFGAICLALLTTLILAWVVLKSN